MEEEGGGAWLLRQPHVHTAPSVPQGRADPPLLITPLDKFTHTHTVLFLPPGSHTMVAAGISGRGQRKQQHYRLQFIWAIFVLPPHIPTFHIRNWYYYCYSCLENPTGGGKAGYNINPIIKVSRASSEKTYFYQTANLSFFLAMHWPGKP